jgi:hypothetical protein
MYIYTYLNRLEFGAGSPVNYWINSPAILFSVPLDAQGVSFEMSSSKRSGIVFEQEEIFSAIFTCSIGRTVTVNQTYRSRPHGMIRGVKSCFIASTIKGASLAWQSAPIFTKPHNGQEALH